MNLQNPNELTKYSFLWSEVRLVIAALALFMGGVPPVARFLPWLSGLLPLAWLISGAAAVYLLYRWNKNNQHLFGGKNKHDLWAFLVLIVSGINLGLVPILSTNIGMSISSNRGIFIIVGIIYLVSAYHLWSRWKAAGERLF